MSFKFANQNTAIDDFQNENKVAEHKEKHCKYKPSKFNINTILEAFGNMSKIFYKKLEQGDYNITSEGLYIVNESIKASNQIIKEVEFTFYHNNLIILSYSESKRDKNNQFIYYKFVSFNEDGKSILHSKENYAINDLRIEIYRDSDGYITEWLEERGKYVDAFNTIKPTSKIKKDCNGNIIETKEWKYDETGRITSYEYINGSKYCLVENSYIEDFIISNYKNRNGITFWNRIFNSKVGKHTAECVYNNKGELIREENFSYNANGDLILRTDLDGTGKILSSKEIQYNEKNIPTLIINRIKDEIIETEVCVA